MDKKNNSVIFLVIARCGLKPHHRRQFSAIYAWCFVRALLSEPGFSGLSDFQDYRFWTLVAATKPRAHLALIRRTCSANF